MSKGYNHLLLKLTRPLIERTNDFKLTKMKTHEEAIAFKEGLIDICKSKLDTLNNALGRLEKARKSRNLLLKHYPELLKYELHLLVGAYTLVKEEDNIEKWKLYWQSLNPRYKPLQNKNGFSNFDIERARTYPIQDLLDTPFRSAGSGKLKALCPFHEEKSPSLIIYTDQNSAHCFGCSKHISNAIDYLIETENLDFKGAIRRLL